MVFENPHKNYGQAKPEKTVRKNIMNSGLTSAYI